MEERYPVREYKGRNYLITVALERLFERDGEKCRRCDSVKGLTIEHIVPRSLLTELCVPLEEQYTDLENLEILCVYCNHLKASKLDFTNPLTKKILQKYLARI